MYSLLSKLFYVRSFKPPYFRNTDQICIFFNKCNLFREKTDKTIRNKCFDIYTRIAYTWQPLSSIENKKEMTQSVNENDLNKPSPHRRLPRHRSPVFRLQLAVWSAQMFHWRRAQCALLCRSYALFAQIFKCDFSELYIWIKALQNYWEVYSLLS